MTQSKPIQKIVIPTVKKADTDESFHFLKFLFNKSTEGRKSNCPLRGSLTHIKDKPVVSLYLFVSLVVIFSLSFSIHIF